MGREQRLKLSIVVSSGSGTGTFTSAWDLTRWVRVVPPSESDTYDCYLKDGEGYIIFDSTKTGDVLTGTLSLQSKISLGIMKTIQIQNASADGTYVCLLDMH